MRGRAIRPEGSTRVRNVVVMFGPIRFPTRTRRRSLGWIKISGIGDRGGGAAVTAFAGMRGATRQVVIPAPTTEIETRIAAAIPQALPAPVVQTTPLAIAAAPFEDPETPDAICVVKDIGAGV